MNLQQGRNQVDFSWANIAIDKDSIVFRVIKSDGTVEVFNEADDMLFYRRESLPLHANGMRFTAFDGDGKNGLYTEELLKHLVTHGLSVEQVFKRTRAGVLRRSEGAGPSFTATATRRRELTR